MASASWAIRIARPGRSESRTSTSYSVSDMPNSRRRSSSSRSSSSVIPIIRARHECCWSSSSQRGPPASVMPRSLVLADALEDHRHALAAADAHGDEAGGLVVPVEAVEHRVLQSGAGHAEGVADGDGAAVDVEAVEVDAEVLVGRHDLGGERLVDLDEVDVADAHAGVAQRVLRGLDRAEAHDLRRQPGHA